MLLTFLRIKIHGEIYSITRRGFIDETSAVPTFDGLAEIR